MANTKSAAKRARQTQRRTVANRGVLTELKTQLREVRALLTAGKKDTAKTEFQKLASLLDKAVKSGRIHRNAANRHKSNLSRVLAASA
jgi:small subunit ribosomal protein S20